jgi:hypothetical protein
VADGPKEIRMAKKQSPSKQGPKKRKTLFHMLPVYDDGTPELANELADLIAQEKGVPVNRPTAVRIAIEEAIKRRKGDHR